MLTLTAEELAHLRDDILELITRHVAEAGVPDSDPRIWLAAMLAADAGLNAAAAEATQVLRAMAREAGMTFEAIAAARGTRKQSEHRAVSRR